MANRDIGLPAHRAAEDKETLFARTARMEEEAREERLARRRVKDEAAAKQEAEEQAKRSEEEKEAERIRMLRYRLTKQSRSREHFACSVAPWRSRYNFLDSVLTSSSVCDLQPGV